MTLFKDIFSASVAKCGKVWDFLMSINKELTFTHREFVGKLL